MGRARGVAMTTVLAIDDEPANLKVIERYLATSEYRIITAEDGLEGWEIVQGLGDEVDVILLDRVMPRMDGMAFLKTIKSSASWRHIPVIMQTAAATPRDVVDGVKAGAYYYLTKPFTKAVLIAIIHAALRANAEHTTLRSELRKQHQTLRMLRRGEFVFRTLAEAHDLAAYLAACFPEPDRTVVGLAELFINAIEHGNLGITYEDKTALHEKGIWLEEVERRLGLPEHASKTVRVELELDGRGGVRLTIRDEGPGFEWNPFLEISPERAIHTHGRGIAMARHLSFDRVEYLGCGNTVVCTVEPKSA